MKKTIKNIWLIAILGYIIPSIGFMPMNEDDMTIKKVVIDAGHGGHDPGNLGTGRYARKEKHIALDVAKMVGKYIEQNVPGVDVIYTRETDKFVELKQRTVIANEADADLFISIHCDAFTSPNAYGCASIVQGKDHTDENMREAQRENAVILLEEDHESKYEGFDPSKPETYIMLTMQQNAYFKQSISLAQKVQNQFKHRVNRKDRGVKQQPLYVTSRTTMPAILIELGFLTNKNEEDFLNSQNGKELMASAIYRAFKEYKKEVENMELLKTSELNSSDVLDYYKENPPQQEEINSPVDEAPIAEATVVPDTTPYYTVQLATSSNDLELLPQNFKGLEDVQKMKEYGLFKYYWGKSEDLDKARALVKQAKSAGYNDAFLVAFYKGKKISIEQAKDIHP